MQEHSAFPRIFSSLSIRYFLVGFQQLDLNSSVGRMSVINTFLTSAVWRDENPREKTPVRWVALVRILPI